MTNELKAVITLIEKNGEYFVSSKEVGKRFGKNHFHVLRDIENLQISDNFRLSNFEHSVEKDSNSIDRPVVYMTRDGFSILAFGFGGKRAIEWKVSFLEAFNKMERFIRERVPMLENRIRELETEKSKLMIDSPKKPHHLKNTVLVPVPVNTLFGTDLEYRRVQRDSDRYSDLTYKEGELKRLASCANGMLKKIDALSREIARQRRN